jgi:hypothetical protein
VLTSIVFSTLGMLGLVSNIKVPTIQLLMQVFPLTIIFMLNVVTGLGGTKEVINKKYKCVTFGIV